MPRRAEKSIRKIGKFEQQKTHVQAIHPHPHGLRATSGGIKTTYNAENMLHIRKTPYWLVASRFAIVAKSSPRSLNYPHVYQNLSVVHHGKISDGNKMESGSVEIILPGDTLYEYLARLIGFDDKFFPASILASTYD